MDLMDFQPFQPPCSVQGLPPDQAELLDQALRDVGFDFDAEVTEVKVVAGEDDQLRSFFCGNQAIGLWT